MTGLTSWEFEFPFPGSLTSTFLDGMAPIADGHTRPLACGITSQNQSHLLSGEPGVEMGFGPSCEYSLSCCMMCAVWCGIGPRKPVKSKREEPAGDGKLSKLLPSEAGAGMGNSSSPEGDHLGIS